MNECKGCEKPIKKVQIYIKKPFIFCSYNCVFEYENTLSYLKFCVRGMDRERKIAK